MKNKRGTLSDLHVKFDHKQISSTAFLQAAWGSSGRFHIDAPSVDDKYSIHHVKCGPASLAPPVCTRYLFVRNLELSRMNCNP